MIGKKLWSAVGLAILLALVSVQGQGRQRFTYEEWLGALKIPIVEDYVRDFLTELTSGIRIFLWVVYLVDAAASHRQSTIDPNLLC